MDEDQQQDEQAGRDEDGQSKQEPMQGVAPKQWQGAQKEARMQGQGETVFLYMRLNDDNKDKVRPLLMCVLCRVVLLCSGRARRRKHACKDNALTHCMLMQACSGETTQPPPAIKDNLPLHTAIKYTTRPLQQSQQRHNPYLTN